ncbi:putative quinol monooxygenase [Porphyrobacter sp. LM 6]|uniref:putative quinol monooxygenase n=1 Tax=Porphyrobacter sp. LM 6 TaxID=1896196 RepID=UPI0008467464|nr:antibiotic biosynthesis monooxygenase family protein [Porphyrobacter sp. LM 6]AOL93239.1 Antibiotic biosynthesis monooxygenase [Porphyrobacter sp. LM 6]
MATLLAHIQIKPGKEEKWEAIMRDMVHHTFATEEGVLRYEYWKGHEENSYYCLLSFKDKWAFYHHQMSDHHEGHDFAGVLAGIKLEYIDPVEGAGGGLPHTTDPALPADASENMKIAQERFPLTIPGWWSARA